MHDLEFSILKTGLGMSKRFEVFSKRCSTSLFYRKPKEDKVVKAISILFQVSSKVACYYKEILPRKDWLRAQRDAGIA